jgi:Na+-translocating ferredoxin:NAD+ oxidoreductase RnfG subunit
MKKIIFISLLSFLIVGFNSSNRFEALIEKEIKAVFSVESFTKQGVSVSEEVIKTLPLAILETNFFKIKNEDTLLGYYYLGKAYGKADYFDFIVIFDTNLIVSKVKILVYREDHGGEIGSRRWLKQFIGKDKNSSLKYQKDIAAISGATISAKAMTNEVNKLLQTIGILVHKQQL